MPHVDVRDISVYHELHGAGRPILAISGTGNDLRRSAPELFPLNEHGQVAHYDQRGLGRTTRGATPPTMEDFADDAAGLMDVLGWDRAIVIGMSFGGMVAQHLALRHGPRVERLVLCCTSPGGALPSGPIHEIERLPPDERAETMLRLLDHRYDPTAPEPFPDLGELSSFVAAGIRSERPPEAVQGYREQLAARAGHDVVDRLGQIACPTLVCAGRYDGLAPLDNSEELARSIPDATLAVFEGGHMFMIQDRRAFPTIVEFVTA